MAVITIVCPNCKSKLKGQEEWLDKDAECPECQKAFVITRDETSRKTPEKLVLPPIPKRTKANAGNKNASSAKRIPSVKPKQETEIKDANNKNTSSAKNIPAINPKQEPEVKSIYDEVQLVKPCRCGGTVITKQNGFLN